MLSILTAHQISQFHTHRTDFIYSKFLSQDASTFSFQKNADFGAHLLGAIPLWSDLSCKRLLDFELNPASTSE